MFTRRHLNSLFWISIIIAMFFPFFFSIIATLLLLPSFVIRLYIVYWLLSFFFLTFFLHFLSLFFFECTYFSLFISSRSFSFTLSLRVFHSLCYPLIAATFFSFSLTLILLSTSFFIISSPTSFFLSFWHSCDSLLWLPFPAISIVTSKPQPKLFFGKYFLDPSPFCRLKPLFRNVSRMKSIEKINQIYLISVNKMSHIFNKPLHILLQ